MIGGLGYLGGWLEEQYADVIADRPTPVANVPAGSEWFTIYDIDNKGTTYDSTRDEFYNPVTNEVYTAPPAGVTLIPGTGINITDYLKAKDKVVEGKVDTSKQYTVGAGGGLTQYAGNVVNTVGGSSNGVVYSDPNVKSPTDFMSYLPDSLQGISPLVLLGIVGVGLFMFTGKGK